MSILTKAALAAALIIVQSQSSTGTPDAAMALRIAGEAGSCPLAGKIAVVNVSLNRKRAGIVGGWSHDDVPPTEQDLAVSAVSADLPDITDGALWLFGPGDSRHPVVRKIQAGARMTLHVDCPGGDFVEAWAPKTP